MHAPTFQPLGTPGTPWSTAEKAQWRARQRRQREDQQRELPHDAHRGAGYSRRTFPPRAFPRHGREPMAMRVVSSSPFWLV